MMALLRCRHPREGGDRVLDKRFRGRRFASIAAFAGMTGFFLMVHGLQPIAYAAEEMTTVQGAFLQGDYKGVISKTEKMIPYSSASQRDQLLYLQGVSALKLRDLPLAKSSLERLLKEYPHSAFLDQATSALNEINRQMSQPAGQPAGQPASTAFQSDEPQFTVQVGAFSTRANADRLQRGLQKKGYDAFVSESAGAENTLYRVRVGRFTDRHEAEKSCDQLRSDGFPAQVKP